MKMIADAAVKGMPLQTRTHLLEEGQNDPYFWKGITPILAGPNPAAAVDEDMKKAAINAFDSSKYRDSGARWPVLQSKMKDISRKVAEASVAGLGYTDPVTGETILGDAPASSSGGDIWSTIAGALKVVAPAAASIYSSTTAANTAKTVAQIQAQAVTQQQVLQQAQLAAQGGSTSVAMYILLGLLGLGGLFMIYTLISRGRR